jgi:ABC-type nitrate/sulfonate/bicarbonate transport system ATPase subunit
MSDGIRIEHATIRYATNGESRDVLVDFSLHVPPGEFVCILGHSGCGKSTLLKAIAGFVRLAEGRVTLDGKDVREPDSDRGMVFQEYALFPWLTVADNILFGDRVRKKPQTERAAILQHYLELVHLEGYGKYFPAQLSGGMKQRVALARAWANAPDVLLLDEPFGALDALSRRELQDELLRIWQAERRTCVFVTHDVAEAAYLADRVIVLGDRPARITRTTAVELPRPRTRDSVELVHVIRTIEAAA